MADTREPSSQGKAAAADNAGARGDATAYDLAVVALVDPPSPYVPESYTLQVVYSTEKIRVGREVSVLASSTRLSLPTSAQLSARASNSQQPPPVAASASGTTGLRRSTRNKRKPTNDNGDGMDLSDSGDGTDSSGYNPEDDAENEGEGTGPGFGPAVRPKATKDPPKKPKMKRNRRKVQKKRRKKKPNPGRAPKRQRRPRSSSVSLMKNEKNGNRKRKSGAESSAPHYVLARHFPICSPCPVPNTDENDAHNAIQC